MPLVEFRFFVGNARESIVILSEHKSSLRRNVADSVAFNPSARRRMNKKVAHFQRDARFESKLKLGHVLRRRCARRQHKRRGRGAIRVNVESDGREKVVRKLAAPVKRSVTRRSFDGVLRGKRETKSVGFPGRRQQRLFVAFCLKCS